MTHTMVIDWSSSAFKSTFWNH